MPLPLTPPTQQGASLTLWPPPYRNPQSRRHLAATQGCHAFTHTSLIGLGHIKEHSLERRIYFFIFSTSHFSSVYLWCCRIRPMKSNRKTYGHPEKYNVGCFLEMFSQLRRKEDFLRLCTIICWYLFIFIFSLLISFGLDNAISESYDCLSKSREV